jgi:hypothetical protein
MIRIVATEEQAKRIAEAQETIEFVDSKGNPLGLLAKPLSDDDIRIARERLSSDEERRPTGAVIARLESLGSV